MEVLLFASVFAIAAAAGLLCALMRSALIYLVLRCPALSVEDCSFYYCGVSMSM